MTTTTTTMAMNTLTETLARATLRGPGGAFPRKANAPDFPLVSTFYLERAPTDEDVRTFAEKLEAFPSCGAERDRRTRRAKRRCGDCDGR